jgi:hypothetical protein
VNSEWIAVAKIPSFANVVRKDLLQGNALSQERRKKSDARLNNKGTAAQVDR